MTIRVVHVGVGTRGRHWLDIVAESDGFESVACVDSDPQALTAVGGRHRSVATFESVADALTSVQADAALLCSPSHLHAPQAIELLGAGLAVLVEKPLARDVAEARGVLAAERSSGKPVVVAENYRFARAERTLRALVADGRLGEIRSVSFIDRRRQPPQEQGQWVGAGDHPQLSEIAVHHFDSMRAIFGARPVSLSARSWNPPSSAYRAGAATEALIELAGGIRIEYLGTLTSHRYSCGISIEGERGALWSNRRQVLWRPAGSRWYRPVRLVRVPAGDAKPYPREGTASLLEGLRRALAGQPAETSAADNLWTIAMLEAAIRSDREARSVRIDEFLSPADAGE